MINNNNINNNLIGQTCIVGDTICPSSQKLKGFLTYVQKPVQITVVNNKQRRAAQLTDDLLGDDAAVENGSSSSSYNQQYVGPRVPSITAAGCGTIEVTEQVLSVKGLFPRYNAEVGDVVVAKVVEVSGSRWICDLGAPQNAILPLSNVTEPGGMLRRRGRDDELSMRTIFKEGDLIVAEVQRVMAEGGILLHTRSASKYGKCLGEGICVSVRPHLVRREGRQFVAFPFGISAVIGVNGRIWVCMTTQATLTAMNASWGSQTFDQEQKKNSNKNEQNQDENVAGDDNDASTNNNNEFKIHKDTATARLDVARMRCCLLLMSSLGCRIDANCMSAAFLATQQEQIPVSKILDHNNSSAQLVVQHAVAQARMKAEREARFEEEQ